ncbi:MAG: tetratricopeptide repeat protein [Candidatus Delongbacteria bacterium]|nr:tetratricopeptide repeat protein [Candidatus Delongbacteria bacterium]
MTVLYFLIPLLILALIVLYHAFDRSEKLEEESASYLTGLRLMVRGERQRAIHAFQEEITRDTENIDAYIKLGTLYRECGEAGRASRIHNELTLRRELTRGQQLEIWEELAQDYLAQGDTDSALNWLRRLLAEDRHNNEARRRYLHLLEVRGQWGEAFEVLKKMAEIEGVSHDSHLALIRTEEARRHFASGEGKKGRVLCKEAIKLDKCCTPAYLLIGQSYVEENRSAEGVEFWERLTNEVPQDAHLVLEDLELELFKTGNFSKVETIYRNLIELAPNQSAPYLALGRFHEKKGEFQHAIDICRAGLAKTDNNIWLVRLELRLLGRLGQTEQILTRTQEVIESLFSTSRVFSCESCKAESELPLWYCPRCHTWSSYQTSTPPMATASRG